MRGFSAIRTCRIQKEVKYLSRVHLIVATNPSKVRVMDVGVKADFCTTRSGKRIIPTHALIVAVPMHVD